MLESQALWLSASGPPTIAGTRPGDSLRVVRASANERELGRIIERPFRWWLWPIRSQISAYEGPDYSALFAGRRAGLLPGDWDIVDADGRYVGLLRGGRLYGEDGEAFGKLSLGGHASGAVIGDGGRQLVRWMPDRDGTRIEFGNAIAEQPFVKMTLWIAILVSL